MFITAAIIAAEVKGTTGMHSLHHGVFDYIGEHLDVGGSADAGLARARIKLAGLRIVPKRFFVFASAGFLIDEVGFICDTAVSSPHIADD